MFALFFSVFLFGCGLFKPNKYIMHYNELRELSAGDKVIDQGKRHRANAIEMTSNTACIEEYRRLHAQGYTLIGYSLFQHEEKLSNGLAVQAGIRLGAHRVLYSRQQSNGESSDRRFPVLDELIKEGPIIKAIFEDETPGKQSQLNLYSHLALFLIKN